MQIVPTKPIVALLYGVITQLERIGYLLSGVQRVTFTNTSIAATQSGSWTASINGWTTTSAVMTTSQREVAMTHAAVNESYKTHFLDKRVLT